MALRSDLSNIRKRFQQQSGGDERFFKIDEPKRNEEVRTTIRVLPPWSKRADGFFYYTAGFHFGFSVGGRNRAIACTDTHPKNPEPCPICKFIARLKNAEEDYEKLIQSIRKSTRYFVNVIDRDNETDGPKIFGTNWKFIQEVLDAEEDMGDITDPRTGRDITIIRTGRKFQTRYRYKIRMKSTKVAYEFKALHQLDKEVEWMPADKVRQILIDNYEEEMRAVGMRVKSSSSEDDEEEDARPKKRKKATRKPKAHVAKKRKKVVEVEDDEEDYEDLDEIEDIDEDDDDD